MAAKPQEQLLNHPLVENSREWLSSFWVQHMPLHLKCVQIVVALMWFLAFWLWGSPVGLLEGLQADTEC